MSILERVKKICLTPQTEWPVISSETAPTAGLITGYVLPLAAVSAVAGLIGGSLIGQTVPFLGTYRVPLATGLGIAVFAICSAVIGVFVISFIINALAPSFGAEKNSAQALKVAVYQFTPAWVAGVFQILPALSLLAVLGALYGLYLLYLGLPRLMKCPPDKAVGYTVVVVLCALVTSFVLGAVRHDRGHGPGWCRRAVRAGRRSHRRRTWPPIPTVRLDDWVSLGRLSRKAPRRLKPQRRRATRRGRRRPHSRPSGRCSAEGNGSIRSRSIN